MEISFYFLILWKQNGAGGPVNRPTSIPYREPPRTPYRHAKKKRPPICLPPGYISGCMQGEILAGAKPLVRVGRNASRLPGEDGLPRRPVPTNGHRVGVQGSGIADDSSVMTAWRWNGRRP